MDFGLLGPLEVRNGAQAVVVRGAKERALLALLLLSANRPLTTERLLDELWGDEPPQTARKSLQVRVANLRRALGADTIASSGGGYTLRVAPARLDVHRFEQHVEDGRRALEDDDPRAAVKALEAGLALWRGPALADVASEPFAFAPAVRLDELRLAATELRIDAELAVGHHAALVPELEALVAEHPRREHLAAQAMLALYRSGRQVDALETYRRARSGLVEEFGIDPGRELVDLERAILRHDPALDVGAPPPRNGAIVVAAESGEQLSCLVALAAPLAESARRELIVVGLAADSTGLTASAELAAQARSETAFSVPIRSTALVGAHDGLELVRLGTEQDADLLLLAADDDPLGPGPQRAALEDALYDIGVVCHPAASADGPVVVPFVGAPHDWTAIELGAWAARATGRVLRLVGPEDADGGSSRLLANASLVVQRALGVDAEPRLASADPDGLVAAAEGASLVVVGLTERWRLDGLGSARAALVASASASLILIRHGLRPGGLAPARARTRFTWTVF